MSKVIIIALILVFTTANRPHKSEREVVNPDSRLKNEIKYKLDEIQECITTISSYDTLHELRAIKKKRSSKKEK